MKADKKRRCWLPAVLLLAAPVAAEEVGSFRYTEPVERGTRFTTCTTYRGNKSGVLRTSCYSSTIEHDGKRSQRRNAKKALRRELAALYPDIPKRQRLAHHRAAQYAAWDEAQRRLDEVRDPRTDRELLDAELDALVQEWVAEQEGG